MLAAACPDDSRLLACFGFEGDLVDGSPATNDAVGMGIAFVPGIDGQALHHAIGNYVELVVGADLATTRLTVDAWIRLDDVDQRGYVIDHDARWALGIEAGGFVACQNLTDQALSTAPVLVATWTHVACTYDGATMTTHIGGVAAGAALFSSWPTGTGTVAIGSNGPFTQPPRGELRGAIDRLRIWNDVLSLEELCLAAGGC
jgi:hypothetical protein